MTGAIRLGFWSAPLTTITAAVEFATGVSTPAWSGPFCTGSSCMAYPYDSGPASFVRGDYLWLYPGFLLAIVFIVLLACIHSYASHDKKLFGQIGLSFALIYAGVITIDYFVQIVVVEPSITSGQIAGLSLFTEYNPHGIFVGLEGLGYLMMSVALLFAAFAFSGGRIERGVRWLFVASFVLAVGSLAGISLMGYDIVALSGHPLDKLGSLDSLGRAAGRRLSSSCASPMNRRA